MSYRLVVREGRDAGRIVPLPGSTVTLGRPGAEADGVIEFEEPSVSRVHAVLQWREEHACYELSNRSFTSPARVDGQPAVSGTLLTHGSLIQLGALVAEIQLDGGALVQEEPFMGCMQVVQGPARAPRRFQVYRRRSLIGRAAGCEICLPTHAVARQHAVMEFYDDLPVLMPLSSATILVNGNAIPRGTFLAPHDLIILGSNVALLWLPAGVLEVEEEEPQPERRPQEPPPAPAPTVAGSQSATFSRGPKQASSQSATFSRGQARAGGSSAEERPAPAPQPRRWRSASLRARAGFFLDLLRRLEAGEPIRRAVEEAAAARLPHLAEDLAGEILAGRSLADALGEFPACFSPYELGMIAAGEEAGTLEGQLHVLATSMRGAVALRSRLLGWMLPAFLALGLGLPMVLLRPVLQHRGGAAFLQGLLATLLGAALLALLLRGVRCALVRFAAYRRREEDLLERLPVIGPVLRLRAGGRFLRSLGPLLNSGLPVQRAALLAAGCTGSTKHALSLLDAARRIEQGSPVLDSLAPTGLLSPEVLAEVGKGEEHGDLPERLAAAAERLHEAASRATQRAFPVVAVALTLLLALLTLASAGVARVVLLP